MPPRIFIQRGISIGQDPQFDSKMHLCCKCQPSALPCGHLPENLLSVPSFIDPRCLPHLTRPSSGGGGLETQPPGTAGSATLSGVPGRFKLPEEGGMVLQNKGEGDLGWQKTPSRLPGTSSPESQGPGSTGLAPNMPSPKSQYIFCRLGRMASLMKEKTTRMPKRLPRLPLVK